MTIMITRIKFPRKLCSTRNKYRKIKRYWEGIQSKV